MIKAIGGKAAVIREDKGSVLPGVLSLIVVLSILIIALMTVVIANFQAVSFNAKRAQALNIAEAGVNYYLWHMAHNSQDYKDGHTTPTTPDPQLGYGPYVHNYTGGDGTVQGTFTLWIKPHGNGSTIFTVRSTGQTSGTSGSERTVEAQIGAKSFASYGLVADTEFWFGKSETANGPIFSNKGVHMDGANTGTVGSANATYVPQSEYGGDGYAHNGVWCSSSVTSPVNCATRDKSSWQYPKPAIDFNGVVSSLCNLKKTAFREDSATSSLADGSNACKQTPSTRTDGYLPRTSSYFSITSGYLIELNPDDTYNLSKVTDEYDRCKPSGWWSCTDVHSYADALDLQPIASNVSIPSDGVIFAEDNVWVRTNPDFHGRVTIAAGRLASSSDKADINIADDLLYSTKNGEDAIGLVAENNVIVKPYAPPPPSTSSFDFEIDAAVLAQNGSVTWPQDFNQYSGRCTWGWTDPDQKLTFYGSVATRQNWTWNVYYYNHCGDSTYDNSNGNYWSGIEHTDTKFDYNLLYAPPPSYPITGSYQILNWREVLTTP